MTEKSPVDPRALNHLDQNLRRLVDEQYDLCLYKCAEKAGQGLLGCKNNCFKNVIVPYRFHNHAARDEEDNLYRKCLSQKFPNIKPDDYMHCTQAIYKDRLRIISDYMVSVTESLLTDMH